MTLSIAGPQAMDRGQVASITVTGTKSGVADATRLGVAIAASDSGTPIAASTSPLSAVGSRELIHSSGVGALPATSSGTASYVFNYTMPAGAAVGSAHTLYAVGALGFAGSVHATDYTVTTRPLVPTGLAASNLTAGTIDLSWSGTGPQYRVVYKTGSTPPTSDSDGFYYDVTSGTSTTVQNLSASTQYSFAVYSKLAGFYFPDILSSSSATATATTSAFVAATRHVNAATGVNTGTCSNVASPCKTITYAMAQAAAGPGATAGDPVSVAPGTYDVALAVR